MAAIIQFNRIETVLGATFSFSLAAGEIRILQAASNEIQTEVIDLALGDLAPVHGEILLQGQPLIDSRLGSLGWVPAIGGLISNLKTWENITLPLWYHSKRQTISTEETLGRWLLELGMKQEKWEAFMASPAARLNLCERKTAGLLRALLLAPQLLVVDAGLFDEVDDAQMQIWIKVLEKFVCEADDRALLVVASAATALPWKIIE